MPRPTRRMLVAAGVGFVAALAPAVVSAAWWPFWPATVAGLAGLFALDALLAPRGKSCVCRATSAPQLHPGEPADASLTIALPSARRLAVELVVDVNELLDPPPPLRAQVVAGRAVVRCPLRARRRGQALLERAWIRYRGPLGLAVQVVQVELRHEIPVVPNVRPVQKAALRFFRDRNFRAGLKIERHRGDGTEFDSLKDFVVGDENRTVHWKASARHRRLLSRHFRAERNHQVVLAVDTGRLMAEPTQSKPKLDHALGAALLLAYVGLASGDRVGLLTFGGHVGLAVEPQGGMAWFRQLVTLTSSVSYSNDETNYTLGLMTLLARLHRRSLVIVLTDFVDTMTAELMVENLGRLSQRHVVVFVSLRDMDLANVAAVRPGDPLALSRATVAGTLLREREVVLRRLRRMGISAIDAPPDAIGPELVNRYLEIRRQERI